MEKDKTSKAFKFEGIGLWVFIGGLFLAFLCLAGFISTAIPIFERIAFGSVAVAMVGILVAVIANGKVYKTK